MQEKSIGGKNIVNDNKWIDKIKANNENVLKNLYIANFPKVRKLILNNNGTEEDAADIFQEAFIAFWRNVQLDKFSALNPHTVDQYLMKIARNKWIDFLRKQKRMNTLNIGDQDIAEETHPGLNDEEEKYLIKVKTHFLNMGEPCKELLYRFYFKKEKLQQIAKRFSWKETTTKNNKYRCLQKLRKTVLDNL